MYGIHRNFPASVSTADATAEQWDIKSGKTAYISGGKVTGTGYFPAMMQFNGSTGYYSHVTVTTSGNKATAVVRFNRAAFTGGAQEIILRHDGPTNLQRIGFFLSANDHANANYQGKLQLLVLNSSSTIICRLISSTNILDGENHTVFGEFDGDAGTAVFRIDGNDEDDTGNASRTAPTAGTLDAGASSKTSIGATSTGALPFGGKIGFCGIRDVGGLTWSDFMHPDGSPKPLDESTWTEWGAQPLFWHESGKMDENKGSAGNMTANGTIVIGAA